MPAFGAHLDCNQELGLTLNAVMPILNWRLENGRYWDRTSDNLLVREVLYR